MMKIAQQCRAGCNPICRYVFIILWLSVGIGHHVYAADAGSFTPPPDSLSNPTVAPRIVGGTASSEGSWPSMAALIDSGSNPSVGQFCGATIIHRRWVLTAAHCVTGRSAASIQVIAGLIDLSSRQRETLDVLRIVRHPDYNDTTLDYDFALLQLQQASGQPAADLYAGQSTLAGETGTAVGWGATNPQATAYTDDLMEVDLPIVTNGKCEAVTNGGITGRMLCAGDRGGMRDACGGDSGGPLFVEVIGRNLQVGITSFGFGSCANPDAYGVYARISSVVSFIRNHVPTARLLSEQDIRRIINSVPAVISSLLD